MEWANAKDGIPRDMKTAGIAEVALSSGRSWAGFAVEEVTYLPQELPSGYIPAHLFGAFDLGAPIKMEHRFPDERWHTSTLVRGGLFLYPAFADFTKVWRQPLPAVAMRIEPASIPGMLGQDLEPRAFELRFGHYQDAGGQHRSLGGRELPQPRPGGRFLGSPRHSVHPSALIGPASSASAGGRTPLDRPGQPLPRRARRRLTRIGTGSSSRDRPARRRGR